MIVDIIKGVSDCSYTAGCCHVAKLSHRAVTFNHLLALNVCAHDCWMGEGVTE